MLSGCATASTATESPVETTTGTRASTTPIANTNVSYPECRIVASAQPLPVTVPFTVRTRPVSRAMAYPFRSAAWHDSGSDAPAGNVMIGLPNVTATFSDAATWSTTTTTCPAMPATVTLAVETPLPRATSVTASLVSATAASDGMTLVTPPATAEPSESSASAVTVRRSPNASKRIVSGEATTRTGR